MAVPVRTVALALASRQGNITGKFYVQPVAQCQMPVDANRVSLKTNL